jgi:ribonuclease-3
MTWTARFVNSLLRSLRGKTPLETGTVRGLPLEKLNVFEKKLRYRIRNREVFAQALQHRSYHQRSHHPLRSNVRLEFLGDSVLNLIVGEYLYRKHPRAEEGELTKMRSRLVNKKALAAYAKDFGLSEFILMSPSAAQSLDKGHETITADTFEAVIAAIYLDGGFDAARSFVERQVLGAMKRGSVITNDENYKSLLLEYAQSHGLGIPRYMIVREEGPDHDRTFTVDVLLSNIRRGSGSGKNKKEAEQAAASQALENLPANAHT